MNDKENRQSPPPTLPEHRESEYGEPSGEEVTKVVDTHPPPPPKEDSSDKNE